MRRIILALVALLFLTIVVLGGVAWWQAKKFLHATPETPGREVVFTVEPGQTFDQVARALEAQNLVTNAKHFAYLGKWRKRLGAIQAGDFKLHTGWTPDKILETLATGKPILYRLSLREGLTWWETARAIEDQGFAKADEVAALVNDAALLAKFHIPFATAEGFLFPETYLLKRPGRQDARFIVELLLKTFWDKAAKVWPQGQPNATELSRVVTLASVVEKETGAPHERRRVAGVYARRLARNMLLQADPTTIYGLGHAFDGNLKRVHLEDPANPYNTYKHPGLPPGPICSPGLESLLAASNPEQHNYLYFVAMGNGTHKFSETLDQHNAAVRKYQLNRQ